MSGDEKRLQAALLKKEENQRYLSNLEQLKNQGRVTAEQYASMKAGYQQSMIATVSEIADVKNQLKSRLQTATLDINSLNTDQEQLRLKRDIGELSPGHYESAVKKISKRIEIAQNDISALQRLIGTRQSGELGVVAGGIRKSAYNEPSKLGASQWITLIWGILGIMVMCVGLIPFLGMLNWINIPFASVGFLVCLITIFKAGGSKWFNIIGLFLCFLAVFIGSIRLVLGLGIF